MKLILTYLSNPENSIPEKTIEILCPGHITNDYLKEYFKDAIERLYIPDAKYGIKSEYVERTYDKPKLRPL